MDPPAGRGRGGFYFDSHLERLRRIQAFQRQGLRLADIHNGLEQGKEAPREDPREIWIHYPIGPGVEIHVCQDRLRECPEKIAKIVRLARSLFDSGGKSHE